MNGVTDVSKMVGSAARYRIWVEPAARKNKSKLILEIDPAEEKGIPRRLPFDANYFDSVIFKQNFPLRTTLFAESLRVLKEGGFFIWTDLKKEQLPAAGHLLIHGGLVEVGEKEIKLGEQDFSGIGAKKPVQSSRH